MPGKVDGLALAATAAGVILVYDGLTGHTMVSTLQSVIQGKNPSDQPGVFADVASKAAAVEAAQIVGEQAGGALNGIGAGQVGAAVGSVILGQQIASDAQRYVGTPYNFGGAPGTNPVSQGIGPHDCSSLVNWVIGHDLGLAIPFYSAGTYHGQDHGPDTVAWLAWTGCVGVPGGASAAQPGDLCCWQTHMGIAIGGGKMVSARSPHSDPPTGIGDIATGGPFGQALFVRRLKVSG